VAENKHSALAPERDNLVKMQRSNCRIDEGTNELRVINEDKIFEIYGNMITVLPTISHGEAFLIVRNHTDKTLSLPSGQLQVEIIPAVSLPVCRASSKEFRELKDAFEEEEKERKENYSVPTNLVNLATWIEGTEEISSELQMSPRSFYNWNCRSLKARVAYGELDRFYSTIKDQVPDIDSKKFI
jgi:hypothetical protein